MNELLYYPLNTTVWFVDGVEAVSGIVRGISLGESGKWTYQLETEKGIALKEFGQVDDSELYVWRSVKIFVSKKVAEIERAAISGIKEGKP